MIKMAKTTLRAPPHHWQFFNFLCLNNKMGPLKQTTNLLTLFFHLFIYFVVFIVGRALEEKCNTQSLSL